MFAMAQLSSINSNMFQQIVLKKNSVEVTNFGGFISVLKILKTVFASNIPAGRFCSL